MGRIAEAGDAFSVDTCRAFTNKFDKVLEALDDDDRAIVLGWIASGVPDEEVELRLDAFDIVCSDSTIRRWRRYQRTGQGRQWGA